MRGGYRCQENHLTHVSNSAALGKIDLTLNIRRRISFAGQRLAELPVTRKDIARELNVSDSLVGKVLNGSANVWASPELCERIRLTARNMGYRPNAAAQALARGRTNLVAVWTIRLDLYARHVTYLQALAQADGYEVLVRQVEYAPAEWHWPADGIVAVDAPAALDQYRSGNYDDSIPVVHFGVEEYPGLDQSVFDLTSGATAAMQNFITRGCRRIAYLLPQHAVCRLDDGRRRAYEDTMRSLGAAPELIVADDMSLAATHEAVRRHTRQHGMPEAIFVFVGEMVSGALQALRAAGARVPADVALAANNDVPELAFLDPPVSAVQIPLEEAAATAWKLLRRRMTNPSDALQRMVHPTRFIERASS